MNVLATGVAGFLGRYVCTELLLAGCAITAISRRPLLQADLSTVIVHDFVTGGVLNGKLKEPVDTIIHMAHAMGGTYLEQMAFAKVSTQTLLDYAISQQVKKFILISSLSVLDLAPIPAYGWINSRVRRLKPDANLPAYPAAKLAQELLVEQAVASGAIDAVILRPGLIYDETVMSNAYAGLIKNKLQIRAKHAGQIPLVSAQQVARVIVQALSAPLAPGLAIHTVLDASPWSMQQYQQALLARGQLQPNAWGVPWQLLNWAGALAQAGAGAFGLAHRLPELFRQPGRAARLKPHRYWPALKSSS